MCSATIRTGSSCPTDPVIPARLPHAVQLCQGPARAARAVARHLPRASDPGPGRGSLDVAPRVRSPRWQPPGARHRARHRVRDVAEPRVPGRRARRCLDDSGWYVSERNLNDGSASRGSDIESCPRFRCSTTRRGRPGRRTALVCSTSSCGCARVGRAGGGDSLAQTALRGSPSRNDLASRSVEPLRELATESPPPLARHRA